MVAATGACGDSSSPATTPGDRGGALTLLSPAPIGSLDPADVTGRLGGSVLRVVNRPLYSYAGPDDAVPAPDVADGAPDVSPDGRRIRVRIRNGIRFAPPVNRLVTSRDVAYAISRAFGPGRRARRHDPLLTTLVGLAAFRAGAAPSISGLQTPDDRTLVLVLRRRARSGPVRVALTALVTAPVPPEYAAKFDRERPSTYAMNQVATGPYMVDSGRLGRIVGYDAAARTLTLVRNPSWNADTDPRPAYVDEITIHERVVDVGRARRRITRGTSLLGDLTPLVASDDVIGVIDRRTGTWDLAATSVLKR